MTSFLQDLDYGARMSLQRPGSSLIALASLALGIVSNTAIYSALNAIQLRSLPVRNPQQLVVLSDPDSHGMSAGLFQGERFSFAYHEFEELLDHNQVFSGVFAVSGWPSTQRVALDAASQSAQAEPAAISIVSGA